MSQISAKDVMKLRNATGLPMMECKKALVEAEGDPEKAETLLRLKLKGKMDKRTERSAAEGLIAIETKGSTAVLVEVRAETDFTAKNEKFASAVGKIAQLAFDAAADAQGNVAPTEAMAAVIDDVRISTGENCSIARIEKLTADDATFASYVHHDGKTAVLVAATGTVQEPVLRDVCMHIAAGVPAVPAGITADDVPAEIVEKERAFRLQQAVESGKPQQIAEKMVEGGMRKFLSEVALLLQPFVKDPSKTIADIIGKEATITHFVRWTVGQETSADTHAAV